MEIGVECDHFAPAALKDKMKISVITPNYNGARFLEASLRSVQEQAGSGVDVEHIVIDGGSSDASLDIVERFRGGLAHVICERDKGPASAINKGLRLATGDVVAWLNSDDCYRPEALRRVAETMQAYPGKALCFGHCPIISEDGIEIRRGITRFKAMFFPVSSRFVIQSINYVSQPAMFFRRSAYLAAGPLREDLSYAWDYDCILRLWRQGGAVQVKGPALAEFRWHPGSLSGTGFVRQFEEELQAAIEDAGRYSFQVLLHRGVRWGIVTIYGLMAKRRMAKPEDS
jgi:glycosyltransferase involved in cell wall biosynthesis